jgi:uncharacterized protein
MHMSAVSERRLFLKYLGAGFAGYVANAATPLGPLAEARGAMPFQLSEAAVAAVTDFLTFGPISPTNQDELVLPAGFRYHTIIAYGDKFTSADERFGFNADFTAFLPRNAEGTRGILWVNHEYVGTATDNYGQAFAAAVGGVPTIDDYKMDVGGSAIEVYKTEGGNWLVVRGSGLNRRFTADSLAIADGPALGGESNVGGTLGNCSGCLTPWK